MNDARTIAADRDRLRDETGLLVNLACNWEVRARKVGNVHPGADFADTTLNDFLVSAAVTANVFANYAGPYRSPREYTLRNLVYDSVYHTWLAVGKNTNLGIALSLAPLACVQCMMPLGRPPGGGFYDLHPDGVCAVLNATTVKDAETVYEAIRIANPGGLGDAAKQDVKETPTVTLLEAMKLAADRDLIARQYANGFADVFELGVPALVEGFEKYGCVEAAVINCQLEWLAAFPDSLIVRKLGKWAGEDVRDLARMVIAAGGLGTAEGRLAGVELDRHLRSDGNKLNPGTTADLVAACLFVALRQNKVKPSAPFAWAVLDWL